MRESKLIHHWHNLRFINNEKNMYPYICPFSKLFGSGSQRQQDKLTHQSVPKSLHSQSRLEHLQAKVPRGASFSVKMEEQHLLTF